MRTLLTRLALAGAVALPALAAAPASADCNSSAHFAASRGQCYEPGECPGPPTVDCEDGWGTPPESPPEFGTDIRDCTVYAFIQWGGYNQWGTHQPILPPSVCRLLVPPAP